MAPIRHDVPLAGGTRLVLVRDLDGELVIRVLQKRSDSPGWAFTTPKLRVDPVDFARFVCEWEEPLRVGALEVENDGATVRVRVGGALAGWIPTRDFVVAARVFLADAAGCPDEPMHWKVDGLPRRRRAYLRERAIAIRSGR